MLICLKSTSLDKITVKQLCETAEINRSTFYSHYANPTALYRVLEQKMTDRMNRSFEGLKNKTLTYHEFLPYFLGCCYENRELFLALHKTDSASFKQAVLEILRRYDFLADTVTEEEKSYIFTYYINGVFSVISRWLCDDQSKSIDEMVELTYYLTHRAS